MNVRNLGRSFTGKGSSSMLDLLLDYFGGVGVSAVTKLDGWCFGGSSFALRC